MPSMSKNAEISILMPVYNADRYVFQSIQSVLAQTFEDFELIVVDDASSDGTAQILSSIRDRRLRLLTNTSNMGIVGSLNRALGEAGGQYIARADADDFCQPTRIARQRAFFDACPDILMVGTGMSVLEHGRISFSRQPVDPDPHVLRWMLHISNPVGHPTMMFPAEVIGRLGEYLREEFLYSEDFDFSHRILRHGDIAVLPEHLVIYRQHGQNATRRHRLRMMDRTAAILRRVYGELFGTEHDAEALLVAKHLIARDPGDVVVLGRLYDFLSRLEERFVEANGADNGQRRLMRLQTGRVWWRLVQASLRAGRLGPSALCRDWFQRFGESRPPIHQFVRPLVSVLLRGRPNLNQGSAVQENPAAPRDQDGTRPLAIAQPAPRTIEINDVGFEEVGEWTDDPPKLYVVVDTEAEFDWTKGFDHSLTNVSSMRQQFRAQSIFERHGARPIYVVDYAVASQAEGHEYLRDLFERRACAIGAHLHPWINPPFREMMSDRNSFAGNLPAELEESKLRLLVDMIGTTFGVSPLFFKAGRYGLGPNTMDALARLGFAVDFSILPMTDLRARGGPDFRQAKATPYRVVANRLLSIPVTRNRTGPLADLPSYVHAALHSPLAKRLRLPGMLARVGLSNTITLTPEGVPAEEQIQLIRSMVTRGHRTFTLHYHSPSLGKHTPYVRSEAELAAFLKRLETVCRFFFETMGGMPGNPADLVPPSLREHVWPRRSFEHNREKHMVSFE